nr:TolC family protein [Verrucomicrobiota bacterium]
FKEQLQVAENLFNAGVGEKYDVTQARVALANAHPTLIRAQNDRRRSIDRLQELIGLPYPPESNAKNVQLDALPEFKPMNMLLNNAMTTAIKNRPEREKIQHDLETAERRLHVETAGQTPEVNLFADYGAESDMFGSGTSLEGWSAGVRLSWDLFDGGSRRGKMQQARSVLKQLQHEDAELKLTIEGEVRKAYYDQQEAAAILATSADIIEQAREALQLAQDRYKAGKGTQLEVLESRLQLTRAQLEASTARHDMALAAVQMKRAIGNSL